MAPALAIYGPNGITGGRRWFAYYFSPPGLVPLFVKRSTAMPSIMLAAEFHKNFLRGFSVPSTRILCSGARKK